MLTSRSRFRSFCAHCGDFFLLFPFPISSLPRGIKTSLTVFLCLCFDSDSANLVVVMTGFFCWCVCVDADCDNDDDCGVGE